MRKWNLPTKAKHCSCPIGTPRSFPLIAANLRAHGVDTRVLEETPQMISESMKLNTGQCIPVNAIALELAEYILKHKLDPATTVLWMVQGGWACNIRMYAPFIKTLLGDMGEGLEKTGVYIGEVSMVDFSPIISVKTYFA